MGERAKRVTVPVELRKQIKHEQGCRCGLCQAKFDEFDLFVHHIQPVAHHQKERGEEANRRENLIALCEPCHKYADKMAFEQNVYLNEIVDMREGVSYQPSDSPAFATSDHSSHQSL